MWHRTRCTRGATETGHPAPGYRRHPPSGCSGRLGAARRWPEPGSLRRRAFALVLCAGPALCAAQTAPPLRNWFDDPFFQVADAVPDCPEPAGPRVTEDERRVQSHRRAELGTTCWLSGQCERPNFYAYDRDIADAIARELRASNPFAAATLWVTVQGRVVYIEGCVPEPTMEPAIEAFARRIPQVQRAIAAVFVKGTARPPYRLFSAP